MTFLVEGCLDPNGIMPQGETYAVSPIQLSYSPYSMSAVYAAPLVPVSVKFNSAQQGKRRPVWVKVLLQVPWVPTAEDVPCSTREKSSGTHGILQEARLKQTAGQRTKSGQEDYLSGKTMFSFVRLQYDEVIMTHQKRDATKLKFLWQVTDTTGKSEVPNFFWALKGGGLYRNLSRNIVETSVAMCHFGVNSGETWPVLF